MSEKVGDVARAFWIERVEQHPHVEVIHAAQAVNPTRSARMPHAARDTPPPLHSHAAVGSLAFRQQLSSAVRHPLDAASLSESVYPGDTVAICIGPGIPHALDWLAALVTDLMELGIRPADIAIFGLPCPNQSKSATTPLPATETAATVTNAAQEPELQEPELQQPELQWPELQWVEHHADDPQSLAMVGVSRHDHPIYVNRILAEADVVLPMVLINSEAALTLAGSIYPSLSSADTQERLLQQEPEQLEESIEAENLVCPFLMLGVVPAPSGQEPEIVAGRRAAVQSHARQRLRDLWTTTPAQHPAVLASIEATTAVGLWERLYQALLNALTLASPQAPIVLLIADPTATTHFSLGQSQKKRSAPRRRFLELVEETTRTRPVFLASDLEASDVEDAGLGAISRWDDLHRILDRSPTVAWLRDADRWSIEP